MAYDENISQLRRHWHFGELDSTATSVGEHLSREIAYLQDMKSCWRPQSPQRRLEVPEEWTHLILPPTDSGEPGRPVKLERYFPLSLISTIFSTVSSSSQLRLVPARELLDRLPDCTGPLFPVRDPPEASDSSVVSAMVNLLLCENNPTVAFYRLASLLDGTYGCQLKLHPDSRFPPDFDTTSLIDFALVPEWKPTSQYMIRRSPKTPLRFLSPALAIGIQFENDSTDSCGLTKQDLLRLARATQPHLEALLIARHVRYPEPFPPPASRSSVPPDCIFGIAFRDMTVFIVAHIPYLDQSAYHYQSLVVDQIPFPPYAQGFPPCAQGDRDVVREGILARIRLIIALLTIRSHTDRVASLWEAVIWPSTIIDADLTLVHECTGIVTPTPSESSGESDGSFWGDMGDYIELASGHEEGEINPMPSEIAHSKELVDGWLLAIQDTEFLEPAVLQL
ncbi:hypothetical protein B0H12DRAFT_1137143 [Mycena haematopus]|nr:hypothetical protein B0H12DRAFT_1137143 [Mycena haematopus]